MIVRYGMDPDRGCTVQDTWGGEILSEVAPAKTEIVVRKRRSNREASFRDYYVVVLEDCVATYGRELHEASLKVMRTRVDVAPSDEVPRVWHYGRR